MLRFWSVAVLLCLVVGIFCEDYVVDIENQGRIHGTVFKNRNSEDVVSYRGIPYAAPPVGDLRFRDPQPLLPGQPFRNSSAAGPSYCVQPTETGIIGEEDCLYLNVFTKWSLLPRSNTPAPVMVWIHGGMFRDGSGESEFHYPEYLMTQNIVLVTLNYRLNVFGFTSFNNAALGVSGNAGLKDQVMALRWIRNKISNFGGNPNNVTLFGQGAGATSVHLHVLSPMSQGLFNRVIMQSGTALSPITYGTRNTGIALAHELSVNVSNPAGMLRTLQEISPEHMIRGFHRLSSSVPSPNFWSVFGPIIENQSNVTETFLTENPFDIIERRNYTAVPMMIGYNDAEGIAFSNHVLPDLSLIIPNDLEITQANRRRTLTEEIQNFYFPTLTPAQNLTGRIYLYTDAWFGFPAVRTALEHLNTSTQNIYLYRFTADTALNVFKRDNVQTANLQGASHEDEIGYLFGTTLTPDIVPYSLEHFAINRMVTLWANFANGIVGDQSAGFSWTPLQRATQQTAARVHFADIGTKVSWMGENPHRHRIAFWTEIYERHFRSGAAAIGQGFTVLLAVLSIINIFA